MAVTNVEPRSPRGPSALFSGVVVLAVIVIAALALTARQPPPPQIAEFAPQAQHQITHAPIQQTTSVGSGAGGGGGAHGLGSCRGCLPKKPTPSSPPPPIYAPAAHHCFGDPPVQIPTDTQGPPCVAYWTGNNGGSTYWGVTPTEVDVAVPNAGVIGPNQASIPQRIVDDLSSFFNRYFEFYGRHIRIKLTPNLPSGGNGCANQQAYVDQLHQDKFLAATDPGTTDDDCFTAEGARQKMITSARLHSAAPDLTSAVLRRLAPYAWSYEMPADQQFAAVGHFICSQWAGRNASYSTDPTLAQSKRKFGLMFSYNDDYYPVQPDIDAIVASMAACGAKFADVEKYNYVNARQSNSNTAGEALTQWAQQAASRMKAAGITTVVAACIAWPSCNPYPEGANSQNYFPEWLLADSGVPFNATVKLGWAQSSERTSLFELVPAPSQVPYPEMPLNRALNLVDPGFQINQGLYATGDTTVYQQLLLIAAGIQMAGPNLTPQTFARGLQQARFPNPYSPEMEGIVGFGRQNYAMTTDFFLSWWSDSAPVVYADEGNGGWCYVGGGKRFTAATLQETKSQLLPSTLASAPCVATPRGP
jgi:hypothetical protein